MEKEDWEELIRGGFCQYNVSIPIHSIQYSNTFLGGPKYRKILLLTKKDIAYYYENFADHFIVGKYCLNKFLKNKPLFKKYLEFWDTEFKKMNILWKKLRNRDLNQLSITKLAKLLEEIYTKSIKWHGIAYNVDAIDATLNPLVENIIKKANPKEKKSTLSAIYNKLTFPKVISYMNRLELEKLELYNYIKKNGIKKSENKINKLIEKYYWTKFGWKEFDEYSKKDFMNEYKNFKLKNTKEKIKKEKQKIKEILKEKESILKKTSKKFKIIKEYINIFDEYASLHDLRKEGQMKSVHSITKIYLEIAKRLKVKESLLFHYWPMELVNVVKDKKEVDKRLLEKRKKLWFCEYYSTGKCVEYYGDEALKMRDEAIGLKVDKQQKEFIGIGASQGRITGIAKVCLSANTAAKKIKKGDILVTGMTMPEFVPSMRIAAAIVTDEGGITCHAAIIARELGKPCVVSTKIATRIIKDGDLLEVNAGHGIVKIIK